MYEILITVYIDEPLFRRMGVRKRKDFGLELRAACSIAADIPLLNIAVRWLTNDDSQNLPQIVLDLDVRTEVKAGILDLERALAGVLSDTVTYSSSILSGTTYEVLFHWGTRRWRYTKVNPRHRDHEPSL